MLKCGETECALGIAEKEFVGTGVNRFVIPMKKFLDEEIRSLQVSKALFTRGVSTRVEFGPGEISTQHEHRLTGA